MVPILDLTRRRALLALLAAALCSCSQPAGGLTHTAAPARTRPTSAPTTHSVKFPGAPPADSPMASVAVPVPPGAQSARVRSVVDGDTVHLVGSGAGPLNGRDQRVRLLEINAPEIHGTVDCFGPEATKTLARLTPVGSTVRVVADRETQDKYGRPLVYIWNEDNTFVNEALVRSGSAVVLFIPPNSRYLPIMRQAEQDARDKQVGQWSACR